MAVKERSPKGEIRPEGQKNSSSAPSPDAKGPGDRPTGWFELSKFSKYSISIVIFNLIVVAYGVLVRATGSGDGCGNHWPLCNGNTNTYSGVVAQIIEASHRASTSLDGLLVIGMVIWAFRAFPKGHQARLFSLLAFAFTIVEGIIGAALVKFQLVTGNASVARAWVMSLHVNSTFMLVGAITLTAYAGTNRRLAFKGQGAVGWLLGLATGVMCFLGVSGAISALGHTLDPVRDVLKAAEQAGTFWMVKVQPMHPYLAVAGGLFFLLVVTMVAHLRPSPRVRRAAAVFMGAYALELLIGAINIQLKAPDAVQMMHLGIADGVFATLIWFIAEAIRSGIRQREHEEVIDPINDSKPTLGMLIKGYFALTKPRVISLLLFTTAASMFAAAGGWPGLTKLLMVMLGGFMAAGAAHTFNMVAERDLDYAMPRTRKRPTVTQRVNAAHALYFGIFLTFGSFIVLAVFANLLSAVLAECGLVFYVSIYTLGLKRHTWQNIVIGGAAGAFPPLVGWASVHNSLGLLAWCLFGIVFLWTPVHFWALAILLKDDYAEAGVPMLPVVKGLKVTAKQIAIYTALTVAVTLLPFAERWTGWTYLASTALLDAWLVVLTMKLLQNQERAQASKLFHFSMLYLALLFVGFAADQSISASWNRAPRVFYSGSTAVRAVGQAASRGGISIGFAPGIYTGASIYTGAGIYTCDSVDAGEGTEIASTQVWGQGSRFLCHSHAAKERMITEINGTAI